MIIRIAFVALVCVSCNKTRFATDLDEEVARYIKLVTRMDKNARSDETQPFTGIGTLSLQSTSGLQKVECTNCVDNGTQLRFEKKDSSGSLYVYEARFNFSYVTTTGVCPLDLSVVYADDPGSPINKSYSIMLCPYGDSGTAECDESSTVNFCDKIRTVSE